MKQKSCGVVVAILFLSLVVIDVNSLNNQKYEIQDKYELRSSQNQANIETLGENWTHRFSLNDEQIPYAIHYTNDGGFYSIFSNKTPQTGDQCSEFAFCGNPLLQYYSPNNSLEWTIDLTQWAIWTSGTDGENITLILDQKGDSNKFQFNPFGCTSCGWGKLYAVSIMKNMSVNWWSKIEISGHYDSNNGNTYEYLQNPIVTSDGGIFISGMMYSNGEVGLNDSTTLYPGKWRSDRYMSAPPFYECLAPFGKQTAWWAKLDGEGTWDWSYSSNSNQDDKFGRATVDQINQTITVTAQFNSASSNCNSATSSWNLGNGSVSKGDSFQATFDFTGTHLSTRILGYDIDSVTPEFDGYSGSGSWEEFEIMQFGEYQIGYWSDSNFDWNGSLSSQSAHVLAKFNSTSLITINEIDSTIENIQFRFDADYGIEFTACLEGQFNVSGNLISISSKAMYLGSINSSSMKFDTLRYLTTCENSGGFDRFDNISLTMMIGVNGQHNFEHLSEYGPSYNETDVVWISYSNDSDNDLMADYIDQFPQIGTQWSDTDGDGYGDNYDNPVWQMVRQNGPGKLIYQAYQPDECPFDVGTSTIDRYGCLDSDNDGQSDEHDLYPSDPTQRVDSDGDGYGDNTSGTNGDDCPIIPGASWRDRNGCGDMDMDGMSDLFDPFWGDPTQWADSDGDGLGDNWGDPSWNSSRLSHWPGEFILNASLSDIYPIDRDNDAYEDNTDDCPLNYGKSYIDKFGCSDIDFDGWSDAGDSHPSDSTQNLDSDGDGFGDNPNGTNPDIWPDDATQWADTDGDGFGDNPNGTNPDKFILDSTQWSDIDNDGYGDNISGNNPDQFPTDGTQWHDTDGDGFGDNLLGNNPDQFPIDSTQWLDSDMDGFGDNQNGSNSDDCINAYGKSNRDRRGCPDSDGDGWSDLNDQLPFDPNESRDTDGDGFGDTADKCPLLAGNISEGIYTGCPDTDGDKVPDSEDDLPKDPTQFIDTDSDGFGDNMSGNNPDDCPNEQGYSTIDRKGCRDSDGDGISNLNDAFDYEPTQWLDSDGDGFGDNQSGFEYDACPMISGTGNTVGLMGCPDDDGDGFPNIIDLYPNRYDAWSDADGDGYTDQPGTNISDDCPSINGTSSVYMIGCSDIDGDGQPDLFDQDSDGDSISNVYEINLGYDPMDALSKPRDTDGDGKPDEEIDDDDDNDGFPDEIEEQRGTDPLDPNSDPLEKYGGGTIYVPGEGFTSQYNQDGIEISFGAFLELLSSEFLAPLLIAPITIYLVLAKRRRYMRIKHGIEHSQELVSLENYEEEINDLITKNKLKIPQALLLRNILERQQDECRGLTSNTKSVLSEMEEKDVPVIEEAASKLANENPPLNANGTVGEDGYEYVNWPAGSHNQWYRPANGKGDWNKWE